MNLETWNYYGIFVPIFQMILTFYLQQFRCKQCLNLLCTNADLVICSLDFPENSLSVEDVGDNNPQRCGNNILDEVLGVRLAVDHAPPERKVVLKHFVAHIHEDGVHTRVEERCPRPPFLNINCVIDQHKQHKGKTGQCRHIGQ